MCLIFVVELMLIGGDFADQCGDTRTGPMCGQCQPGRSEWSGQCVVCNKTNPGYVILFLLVTFLGAWFFWRTSQVSTGQMKVFFFFVQTAVIIVAASQNSLRWMDFFNFQPSMYISHTLRYSFVRCSLIFNKLRMLANGVCLSCYDNS
jgi:hypothetical protein